MTSKEFTEKQPLARINYVLLFVSVIMILLSIQMIANNPPAGRRDRQTPTIGAVYQPYGEDFAVHIEKVDPDATNIHWVNYILLDESGSAVPGVQGSVKDILNLDPDHPQTNITFHDNDRDEKISSGDVFVIIHRDNGGEALPGYSLLLKFEITGDKMNGGGTRLG